MDQEKIHEVISIVEKFALMFITNNHSQKVRYP